MPASYPSPEEVDRAVERSIEVHQRRARRKPEFCFYTDAAMEEVVSGYAIQPEPFGIGWWVVGILVDTSIYECPEHFIIMVPGHQLLRTTPRYEVVELPRPPKPSRWYFSGATKRWEINPDILDEEDPEPSPPDLPDNEDMPGYRSG